MIVTLDTARLRTIEQVDAFMQGTAAVGFSPPPEAERYGWIGRTLNQFAYPGSDRRQRGLLRRFIARVTGYSRAQVCRLIAQHRDHHRLQDRRGPPAVPFAKRYGAAALRCLIEIDRAHDTLSGPATKKLAERAVKVHGQSEFTALAGVSVSHLYNLRASAPYRKQRLVWRATRPSPVTIGKRQAPAPQGLPGYIRIDTVHQGDQDGMKGVYHINAVDIVTQWELVACVERISEAYLLPVIALLLEGFPFEIRGFHSDSGSEYVNHEIARLLEKLRVEFTKSRPRQTNDNALAECKNGAVIRKLMGYSHIPQKHATAINRFYTEVLNPYLNFHRPCYFAVDKIDAKGKIRKTYPHDQIKTPWDRLQSIPDYQIHLKSGITSQRLEHEAHAMSDNAAAKQVQQARKLLFQSFNRRSKSAA